LTVIDAWKEFGEGNGASTLSELFQLMNSASSQKEPLTENAPRGAVILDDVTWLDEPIDSEALGVHVASATVRGRTLTDHEVSVLMGAHPEFQSTTALHDQLMSWNEQYAQADPKTRAVLSNRIERAMIIVKLLKQLHPQFCQLCQTEFFKKRGGTGRYSEVHHITELSKGGSQATDNCLVLCATCHRKMHYGLLDLENKQSSLIVYEEGKPITISKNILSVKPST
jgi:hypothetical protein